MNKNVLVISASPRKGGNSDTLCDELSAERRNLEIMRKRFFWPVRISNIA